MRRAAAGRLHMERIENLVGVGRPDVDTLVMGSFVPIELKQIARFPVRATSRVLGDKGLSIVQQNWHLNWRRWGGRSMVVVGVDVQVFAFDGALADNINAYNTAEFKAAASVTGIDAVVELLITLGHNQK